VAIGKVLDLELALMLEAYRRRSREVEQAQYAVLHAERIAARLVRSTRDAVDAALCYAELLRRSSEAEREAWAARLADALRASTRAERLELSVAGSDFLPRSERASRLCDGALANVSLAHGTEAEVTLEPEDLVVVGDCERLQRALEELLQNAANHDPGGKVKLAVRREPESICFEVTDTGAGWPAHVRTLDDLPASGGLGLAFCAYVADLHGGSVEILRPEAGGAGVRLMVAGTPNRELFEHEDLAEDSRRGTP
jgi:signal transduction histidine kinase